MECINCGIVSNSNYCPSCGEKKNVDRICFSSITENLFSGFVNMDKGFLFNIKNLTISPHQTIHKYINGKRRQVLNPFSYAIITISIYLIISSFLKVTLVDLPEEVRNIKPNKFSELGMKVGKFLHTKIKYFWLLQVLYLSLLSKLFFKRFNFFEHLAINSFVIGHATLLAILVKVIYRGEILVFNILVFIYIIFLLYKVFSNQKNKFEIISISTIIVFLSYILFMTLPILIVTFF